MSRQDQLGAYAGAFLTLVLVTAAGALGGTIAELWLPTYLELGGRGLNTGPLLAALFASVALLIWSALHRDQEVDDGGG